MNNTYFSLLLSLVSYIIFFKAIHYAKNKPGVMERKNMLPGFSASLRLQITGIILFGLPVAAVVQEQMELLSFPNDPDQYLLLITSILCIILFTISWLFAIQKNKQHFQLSYPLNTGSIAAATYFLFRILYLAVYEFFFRGVLLFGIATLAGIAVSIIVNIILYVIIHLFDDRRTIIGAVPFGILLCWLSWETQSVWPAVVLHLVLALTNEIKTFYHLFQSPKKIIL